MLLNGIDAATVLHLDVSYVVEYEPNQSAMVVNKGTHPPPGAQTFQFLTEMISANPNILTIPNDVAAQISSRLSLCNPIEPPHKVKECVYQVLNQAMSTNSE